MTRVVLLIFFYYVRVNNYNICQVFRYYYELTIKIVAPVCCHGSHLKVKFYYFRMTLVLPIVLLALVV